MALCALQLWLLAVPPAAIGVDNNAWMVAHARTPSAHSTASHWTPSKVERDRVVAEEVNSSDPHQSAAASSAAPHSDAAAVMTIATHTLVLCVLLAAAAAIAWRRLVSEESVTPAGPKEPRVRLPHLDSLRFLFAFFIVVSHVTDYLWFHIKVTYSDSNAAQWARRLAHWNHAFVCYFVVLSGFVTQMTSPAGIAFAPLRTLGLFYAKRFLRVFIVTWLALSYTLAVSPESSVPSAGWIILQFLELAPWDDFGRRGSSATVQINGPAWTIAVLLPCWMLFPATQWLLARMESRWGTLGLVSAALAPTALALGRVLTYAYAKNLTDEDTAIDHNWPPVALGDFAIGVVAASLVRRHRDAPNAILVPKREVVGYSVGGYSLRGAVADAIAISFGLIFVLIDPEDGSGDVVRPYYHVGLSLHLLSLPYAVFMYASAAGSGAGLVARLLSNKMLEAAGEYSLTIYMLQWPCILTILRAPQLLPWPAQPLLNRDLMMAIPNLQMLLPAADERLLNVLMIGPLAAGMWAIFLIIGLSVVVTELMEKPLTKLLLALCMLGGEV